MKHTLYKDGGRPLNNDDFVTMQDEIYYAINGQLLGLPACVVCGCDVTAASGGNYDVASGLVYLDGEIRRFEGVSDVALPLELYTGPFTITELRAYQTGGSKETMGEALVLSRPFDAANPGDKVLVKAEGVLRVSKAREALFRQVNEIGMVADFPPEWDSTGRGKYGTNSFGWALCNGNNGTPNMGGRFPVGFSSDGALGTDYNATRKMGGLKEVQLTVEQMPYHTHTEQQAGSHSHSYVDTFPAEESTVDAGNNKRRTKLETQVRQTESTGWHTHAIDPTGDDRPHENRPPYLVLAFRMWVGF
jgi:microcystin-dependent protein